MRASFAKLGHLLICFISLQFIIFVLEIPIAVQAVQIEPKSNDSRNNPILGFNGSSNSYFWVDEAGSQVPMSQEHLILGLDNWQNNDTFEMIVVGDSIAWGSGLEQKDKYYYKVANWLQNKLKKPVEVTVLAHTGATLVKPKYSESTGHNFVNPELSSWDPTSLEQVNNIINPENVDLILFSGGINDVDIDIILNPMTNSDEIRTRCLNIESSLEKVLGRLLDDCIKSKIIVTSYYPIVSNNMPESALNVFVDELQILSPDSTEGQGLILIKTLLGAKQIILMMSNNSQIFDIQSRLSIANAIEKANQYSISCFNEKRVFFAPVEFPSNRSYGTNESWLWKLTDPKFNNGKQTNDERYNFRVSFCRNVSCDENEKINAIGHPNVDGAEEYSQTVIRSILNFL